MKKTIFLLSALIIFGLGFSFNAFAANKPVTGYAWSENIGWIDFSPAVHGGVYIDSVTGNMTGYAWSENIGWIDFYLPIPIGKSPTYSARVDLGGANMGEVSGWARVLAHGGGWDGWIKTRGVATDPATTPYGVSIDTVTGHFSGWAWSDMVVGWISFNHADPEATGGGLYRVEVDPGLFVPPNQPPTAINLLVNSTGLCNIEHPAVFLEWTFSDPDAGDIQSAFHVQVDNDPGFPSPEVDSGKVISSHNEFAPSPLAFNTTYHWRVMVWDNHVPAAASVWATGTFATIAHPWPDQDSPHFDFIWWPERPTVDEVVQFTDRTQFHNPDPLVVRTWKWDFENDGIIDSTDEHPTHIFTDHVKHTVRLRVTDGIGFGPCYIEKYLTPVMPLPEWWEVAPFGLLNNTLVGIVDRINSARNPNLTREPLLAFYSIRKTFAGFFYEKIY